MVDGDVVQDLEKPAEETPLRIERFEIGKSPRKSLLHGVFGERAVAGHSDGEIKRWRGVAGRNGVIGGL